MAGFALGGLPKAVPGAGAGSAVAQGGAALIITIAHFGSALRRSVAGAAFQIACCRAGPEGFTFRG